MVTLAGRRKRPGNCSFEEDTLPSPSSVRCSIGPRLFDDRRTLFIALDILLDFPPPPFYHQNSFLISSTRVLVLRMIKPLAFNGPLLHGPFGRLKADANCAIAPLDPQCSSASIPIKPALSRRKALIGPSRSGHLTFFPTRNRGRSNLHCVECTALIRRGYPMFFSSLS